MIRRPPDALARVLDRRLSCRALLRLAALGGAVPLKGSATQKDNRVTV
jgi:hypothetical protein